VPRRRALTARRPADRHAGDHRGRRQKPSYGRNHKGGRAAWQEYLDNDSLVAPPQHLQRLAEDQLPPVHLPQLPLRLQRHVHGQRRQRRCQRQRRDDEGRQAVRHRQASATDEPHRVRRAEAAAARVRRAWIGRGPAGGARERGGGGVGAVEPGGAGGRRGVAAGAEGAGGACDAGGLGRVRVGPTRARRGDPGPPALRGGLQPVARRAARRVEAVGPGGLEVARGDHEGAHLLGEEVRAGKEARHLRAGEGARLTCEQVMAPIHREMRKSSASRRRTASGSSVPVEEHTTTRRGAGAMRVRVHLTVNRIEEEAQKGVTL
jgi:hypothetical protein